MTIYVFFPVALFYYFNRPEFYRKTVEEKKVRSCSYFEEDDVYAVMSVYPHALQKILYPEGNVSDGTLVTMA